MKEIHAPEIHPFKSNIKCRYFNIKPDKKNRKMNPSTWASHKYFIFYTQRHLSGINYCFLG